MKIVAFIPARSGSKRVTGKNIKELCGHPLLAYAVRAAIDSSVFNTVICATDNQLYADIATHYGAEVPCLRPTQISGDTSPDIEWILWMFEQLRSQGREYDAFSVLRPTAPFRQAETIRRAWKKFADNPQADSLRAISKCREHPGKMWVAQGDRMLPLMPFSLKGVPWHSNQYAALPEVFTQNASLEIAWTKTALQKHSLAGEAVVPFLSEGLEGFDINAPEDWMLASHYLAANEARLPEIEQQPFTSGI